MLSLAITVAHGALFASLRLSTLSTISETSPSTGSSTLMQPPPLHHPIPHRLRIVAALHVETPSIPIPTTTPATPSPPSVATVATVDPAPPQRIPNPQRRGLLPVAGPVDSPVAPHALVSTTSDVASTQGATAPTLPKSNTPVSIPADSPPILTDAEPIDAPAPDYPALSRRYREEGSVVVRVSIGKDGTAKDAHIHRSSGFRRLDTASLRTALSWKYRPAMLAGAPQERWHDVPFRFELTSSTRHTHTAAQAATSRLSTIESSFFHPSSLGDLRHDGS
ncbi:periplasmic protein TonB [Candidatus Symbiobacter mobilis CR]|uniref:Periplasmic protein TonB n=2 Tax=Candidatus Symbiobacter TaxID=1436289 RepID=U5N807_9BURK|nr:periplasmic protein TonB [Candidatus Symbiobacter mobilis CR]